MRRGGRDGRVRRPDDGKPDDATKFCGREEAIHAPQTAVQGVEEDEQPPQKKLSKPT